MTSAGRKRNRYRIKQQRNNKWQIIVIFFTRIFQWTIVQLLQTTVTLKYPCEKRWVSVEKPFHTQSTIVACVNRMLCLSSCLYISSFFAKLKSFLFISKTSGAKWMNECRNGIENETKRNEDSQRIDDNVWNRWRRLLLFGWTGGNLRGPDKSVVNGTIKIAFRPHL